MLRILAFGDSITFGVGESPARGWAGRLKEEIEQKARSYLFNLGVPGDTSGSLLNRMNEEISSRMPQEARLVIMTGIGINDSMASEDGTAMTEKGEFRRNITSMIATARKHSREIVLVGLAPVDEGAACPLGSSYFTNSRVEEYNSIIRECCRSESVNFVDVFSSMIKKDYKGMLADGLHPNEKGYDEMHRIISGFLKEKGLME